MVLESQFRIHQITNRPTASAISNLNIRFVMRAKLPAFSAVSKYPEVRRDLAVLVDRDIAAVDILSLMKEETGDLLKDLILLRNQKISQSLYTFL